MRGKHGDEERRPATHACPQKTSSGPHVNTSALSVTPGPLCARRERPRCRRTAEQRDELASPHGLPQPEDHTLPHRCRNAALCTTTRRMAEMVRLGRPADVRCMTVLPPKAEVDPRCCSVAEVHTSRPMHRSKHQAGPSPRSVSGTCLSSALLTNSTESIAAPSWVRNCSIASFIGGGRSPHQSITRLIASSTVRSISSIAISR
jgi:hypothetical protein